MEKIGSIENNQFKFLKKLKLRKYREEFKLYLGEGIKFLDFDEIPKYIVLREGELEKNSTLKNSVDKKIEQSKDNGEEIKVLILSEQLFKELSSQENSQGAILVYPIQQNYLEEFGNNIVILDRVSDPGNLGTIVRLCDASGFKDIILVKGCVDIYNEKVVRSAMGSIFGINFVSLEEDEVLNFIKEKGYRSYITALEPSSIPYTDVKLREKNAFVFGNEGSGVSKNFLEQGDETVIIPIYGLAESLNVAVTCGIFLYKMREIMIK